MTHNHKQVCCYTLYFRKECVRVKKGFIFIFSPMFCAANINRINICTQNISRVFLWLLCTAAARGHRRFKCTWFITELKTSGRFSTRKENKASTFNKGARTGRWARFLHLQQWKALSMNPPKMKRRRMAELEPWIEKLIQNYGQIQSESIVKANVIGVSNVSFVTVLYFYDVVSVIMCVVDGWNLWFATDRAHRCLYAVTVRRERGDSRSAKRRRLGASAGVRDPLNLCYDTAHCTPEPLFLSFSSG